MIPTCIKCRHPVTDHVPTCIALAERDAGILTEEERLDTAQAFVEKRKAEGLWPRHEDIEGTWRP